VVTFTDNCDAEVAVISLIEETGTQCNMVYHYTWTATDDCGNETVVDQFITVLDETAPVFNVESASFNAECGAEVSLPAVSAIDNCGGEVTITSSESIVPGNCANNYTAVTTYTASDVCGNTASIAFTVNYNDTTAPVWSADNAASFTYECNQDAAVVQPVANDVCSTVDYLYTDGPVNSNGCTGSFVRSWIASDACGNATAAFDQTITFEDTTEPVLVGCPGDVTLPCDATVPAAAEVTATDNCDPNVNITVNENALAGNCPQNYSIERMYIATDWCGNADTVLQIINIQDTTAPIFKADNESIYNYTCP
jgi:hypothetical protein